MSGYPEMGEWLSRIYSLRVADTNGYPLVDSLVGLLIVRSSACSLSVRRPVRCPLVGLLANPLFGLLANPLFGLLIVLLNAE